MQTFIPSEQYPQMVGYRNSMDFHIPFDEAITSIAKRIIKEQERHPRRVMWLHAYLEGPSVTVHYRVVAYVDSPKLLLLEVPEEQEFLFINSGRGDYFMDTDDFPGMRVMPNETMREGKKFVYFGSYKDRLREVSMEDLPNRRMTERLNVL